MQRMRVWEGGNKHKYDEAYIYEAEVQVALHLHFWHPSSVVFTIYMLKLTIGLINIASRDYND